MSGQLDKGREFLGVETQQNRAFTQQIEKLTPTHANFDETFRDNFLKAPDINSLGLSSTDDLLPDFIKGPEGYTYNTKGMNMGEFATSMKEGTIKPLGKINLDKSITPSGAKGWTAPEPSKFGTGAATVKGAGVAGTTKELSKLEKWGLGVSTAGGAVSLLQTAAGYGDDPVGGGGLGPAEVALIPYESSNVDWVNQGFAGQPSWGIGNSNYFQSVVDYSNTDPYYQHLTRLTA